MNIYSKYFWIFLVWVLLVGIWSAYRPHDYFTWFLESFPVIFAIPVLCLTGKRFPLTPLLYILLSIHAAILMVGGHYTYAEVPLFNWIRDAFNLSRNHYDRVGHLAQGFIPALVAREILLRNSVMKTGKWLFFVVVCICLAISAVYELIECGVALMTGEAADAFLGTQGDVWDTQSDMFLALVGSILGLLILGKFHDRQLKNINIGKGNL
jgi:putative membrane protein